MGTAFDAWFGDKGLRDASGQPLIVYHGAKTPESLTRFTPGGPDGAKLTGDVYGVATYATTSADEAAAYIDGGGAVFPLYVRGELLDVDGPLTVEQQRRLTAFANEHMLDSDKARFAQGRRRRSFADVQEARDFFDSQRENWRVFGDGMERAKPEVVESEPEYVIEYTDFQAEITITTGDEAFTLFRAVGWDSLPAAGFDGMVMNREGGARWVVMHRTDGNIKSAFNSGAFDPYNPDIRFSELADAEKQDVDDDHDQALEETGFWGRAAAGSIILSRRTGRVLLPLRSEWVLEPGTWGTWGGAIDSGESPEAAARRELIEEAGLSMDVSVEMIPLMVFKSGDFRYHNFAAVVDEEFEPQLNWESDEGRWVSLDDLPTPLHPGLQALMQDQASLDALRGVRAETAPQAPRFTAEFLQWMDGSAIVDDAQKPLKVYHGSAVEISDAFRPGGSFKHGHGQQMPAIYFTPLRESARAYARTAVNALDASSDAEGVVHEVYLSLKNPKRYDDIEAFAKAKREKLIAAGHDGAVRINDFGEVVEIAVFEASQVRLASEVEVGMGAAKDRMCRAIADTIQVAFDELPSSMVVTTTAEMEAELQARRKAAWEAWFGGSKAVDAAGNPLVLYHGTTGNFDAFSLGYSGSDGTRYCTAAIFATTDAKVANDYAVSKTDREIADAMREMQRIKNEAPGVYGESYEVAYQAVRDSFKRVRAEGRPEMGGGANVMPLYMSLQNPLEVDAGGKLFMEVMPENVAKAATQGYDGLIVRGVIDPASAASYYPCDVFIAFRPEQIKSAIGNRGTYDPRDPDIRHSVAGPGARAQAWHDASTNTTVFLADRIPAGREASVFLHEIVHRHGRAALPAEQFGQLVDQVKAWAEYGQGSTERAIYAAAQRRVATARVTGAAADEELFAYAVEEAVARGVQPSAAAVKGSAEQWLQAVVQSIQRIGEKLIGNDLQGLDGQDLVDLAYALAQVDSPEHGVDVRKALDTLTNDGQALLASASHISCEFRMPGVRGYVIAERGKYASIYEWSGDGSRGTIAALQALKDYSAGNVVVHDPGMPGMESFSYWKHMQSRGLVQVLLDELGMPIEPANSQAPEMAM